jgi:HEPN domain-containing protein
MPDLRHRLENAIRSSSLAERVTAAVLFGSLAAGRGTARSDVDLLIIAGGLPVRRHHRSALAAEIKRQRPGLPLDVLLLTADEARSNFTNHNPLFLDIAFDGIVVMDLDGDLTAMMAETREYVQRRGIVRTPDGWRFPIRPHAVAYLSTVTNRDFALGMLRDGERDWMIAERLVKEGFYDKAVYHLQQGVEKAVKGILIALGTFHKTHFVGALLRQAIEEGTIEAEWKDRLAEVAAVSEELEPDMSLSRYPAIINDALWLPSKEYTQEDARESAAKAARALSTAKSFLDHWFCEPPDESDVSL